MKQSKSFSLFGLVILTLAAAASVAEAKAPDYSGRRKVFENEFMTMMRGDFEQTLGGQTDGSYILTAAGYAELKIVESPPGGGSVVAMFEDPMKPGEFLGKAPKVPFKTKGEVLLLMAEKTRGFKEGKSYKVTFILLDSDDNEISTLQAAISYNEVWAIKSLRKTLTIR